MEVPRRAANSRGVTDPSIPGADMSKRTQITQALRYQVMRRDQFTCQYCGAQSPNAALQIDHVVPAALGGSNDPENLVTACTQCNAGKGKSQADEATVAAVSERNLRWADALAEAAHIVRSGSGDYDGELDEFRDAWQRWRVNGTNETVPLPSGYRKSVVTWLSRGLDIDDLVELIPVAMEKRLPNSDRFRYYAGCAWRRVEQIEQIAEQIMVDGGEA